jgi:PKD repeat protein
MRMKKALLIPAMLILFSSGCYKNEPVPVASFTFKGTNSFKVPCTVTFINNSENAFHYAWDFGDDSTSWAKDPVKVYTIPGKYLVSLRAYTESEKEWASAMQTVTISDTIH